MIFIIKVQLLGLMFRTPVREDSRSVMNVVFVLQPEYKELEQDFLKFTAERGMSGLKGHRSVGGFRASTYNALERESVEALVQAMQEFENLHGK